jgi:poly(beta-D-mannuronate) lyase
METVLQSLLIGVILIFSSADIQAKSFRIKSVEEYKKVAKTALPGDTLLWENGSYTDVVWDIKTNGLAIIAATPGKVKFSGSSAVKIFADNVVFSGFQFKDGSVKEDVVSIAGNNNIISNINIDNYDSHYYFQITAKGKNNTVEYCNFENKPSAPKGKEGSSVFQVSVDSIHPGYHKIRYCSFKNHTAPPNSGGDYGMEALRIGYSFQSKYISRTIVEYCYFATCNGDGEIISNKACENIFRYNTFENNGESHLTLRHGSNNVVYGNFFVNGAGIRIKEGQNQAVYNNYFNTGQYFTIKLENYKADPLENIIIVHNTFARSGSLKMGGKGDFQPQHILLGNNLFIEPTDALITDLTENEILQNNGFQSDKEFFQPGFNPIPEKINDNIHGFFQPQYLVFSNEKQLDFNLTDIPELDDDPLIMLDIAGNLRPVKNKSAGCFEPVSKASAVKPYATIRNTGPRYLFP